MTYTKVGPFTNGTSPYLDATFFNGIETALNSDPAVYATSYGVKADGTTDDTAAMQNFVTAVTSGSLRGVLPSGTIQISDKLTIGQTHDWEITGSGQTLIRQATANTPIFYLSMQYTYRWRLSSIDFTWASAQPATNTSAIAVAFGYGNTGGIDNGAGIFNWSAHRLRFNNGWAGLATWDTSRNSTMWGCEVDEIWHMPTMTGPAFLQDTLTSGNGAPNIRLSNMYLRMDAVTGPGIIIRSASTVVLENIEINQSASTNPTAIELSTVAAATLTGIRSEQPSAGVPTSGTGLILLKFATGVRIQGAQVTNRRFTLGTPAIHYLVYLSNGSKATIGGISTHGITADASTTFAYVGTDGATSTFTLENTYTESSTGTVVDVDPAVNSSSVLQYRAPAGNLAVGTATATATFTVNGSFATKITQVSDTNYTVGSADVIVQFRALTAARTVTLPDVFSWTGRWLRIVNDTANTSTITIAAASTQKINGSTTAKTFAGAYAWIDLYSSGSDWLAASSTPL